MRSARRLPAIMLASLGLALPGGCDIEADAELTSAAPVASAAMTSTAAASTAASAGTKRIRDAEAGREDDAAEAPTAEPVADLPLEAYRIELLELAFDTASAMPIKPHIKTRSRLQHEVVEACLELNQPKRALACAERIGNWRRGLAFAEYAAYGAEHGERSDTQHYLREAEKLSQGTKDWRRDRIRVRIADALVWLGFPAQALEFEEDVADSEAGKVNWTRVERMEDTDFEQALNGVDHTILTGTFDVVKNTLIMCVRLYDRFYLDEARRTRVAETVTSSWNQMPIMIRVELMMEMARVAIDHDDHATALALVNEAQPMLESGNWHPEYAVPFRGRLAAVRAAARDADGARAEIATALGVYEERKREIADVFRAEALRPLAEAHHELGDRDEALAMYKRLVEASVENPNARPRAEDLTQTCISLARHAFEPDEALRARLRSIREGLQHPW